MVISINFLMPNIPSLEIYKIVGNKKGPSGVLQETVIFRRSEGDHSSARVERPCWRRLP